MIYYRDVSLAPMPELHACYCVLAAQELELAGIRFHQHMAPSTSGLDGVRLATQASRGEQLQALREMIFVSLTGHRSLVVLILANLLVSASAELYHGPEAVDVY